MQTQVNRELVTARLFDSGALGVLASVIHQFPKSGRYNAQVLRNGQATGTLTFVVDEASDNLQLDVDLSKTDKTQLQSSDGNDCGCAGMKTNTAADRVVSPKGYVVFYASTGAGYAVRVGQGDAVAFDSQQLGKGDLFSLSLFEPTRYSAVDQIGGGKADISVMFSPDDAKRLRTLDTLMVDVTQGAIKPDSIKLTATQGMVFQVQDTARIVVEKLETVDGVPATSPGPRRWVKPTLNRET